MTHIDLYVVIVSDHNLAELRACLYYQPRNIWLISSAKMSDSAKRLATVLQNLLPTTHLVRQEANSDVPFSGNYLTESQRWIESVLMPQLHTFKKDSICVLNMTGGTKTLSYLLTRSYSWQEIHYQPFGATVSLERFCIEGQDLTILPEDNLSEVTISPKDNALLYMDFVKSHSPNPIRKNPNSLLLAQMRIDAMQNPKSNGFGALTPLLELGWSQSSKEKFIFVPSHECLDENLIQQLNELCGNNANIAPLTVTHQGLKMPALSNNAYKNWRKWVSGDCYEQLIEHWLISRGIKQEHILSNVQLSSTIDPQGQETDTLLQYKNRLYVIEIKADRSPTKSLGDMENQLSSLSGQLGKVEKVLFVSPALRQHYDHNQWLSFQLRCQNKHVKLFVIAAATDLKAIF